MSIRLSGEGSNLRGRVVLGDVEGAVTGVAGSSGDLSLTGTLSDDVIRLTLTEWDTKLRNGQMSGTFSFRARGRVLPGTANAKATVRVLGRVD